MAFKVGDRVRDVIDGDVGVIVGVDENLILTRWDDGGYSEKFDEEIELVEEQPNRTHYAQGGFVPKSRGWAETPAESYFESAVHRHLNKIADILIAKNKAYGDSALNPIRAFSKASRIEQLNVRIDDKISRIQRGTDFEDEDTVRDLIGYLVLRLIAEEGE